MLLVALVVLSVSSLPAAARADGPTISHFSPHRSATGGKIVISGTGFSTASDVTFGATSAAFNIDSDAQIKATVPATATSGPITVTTTEGSAVSDTAFVVEPNIVLILTDDQRYDDLANMPNVQSELAGKGVTFDRSFVSNPLCCPSRTAILTGDYSHTTMIYGNHPPYGGF